MKLITKSIAALAAGLFFALTVACAKPAPPADPGQTPKYPEAIEFAMSLGVGWNLGNSFDAHIDGMSGETLWAILWLHANFSRLSRLPVSAVCVFP